MQEKDSTQKTFESYNDVFADIVNVLLFNGEQIVKEDSLIDAQPFSQYKASGKSVRAQNRDVAKYWRNGELRLSLIGFENQTMPDKFMPIRIMSYDAAEYRSQLSRRKKEKINVEEADKECYPIVSLVLYFGTEHKWKTNLHLKDVISIPSQLDKFVSDYKINVINLAWLEPEQISMFKSGFREVVEFLRALRLGRVFEGQERKIEHEIELVDLLFALSKEQNFKQLEPEIMKIIDSDGGEKMNTVFKRYNEIVAKEAVEERENLLLSLFSKLRASGKEEELDKALSDREYLKKLMDEYQK